MEPKIDFCDWVEYIHRVQFLNFRADKFCMNISEMLRLAFRVVADWRVIVTAVLTIFIISLANYVIRYKKKPLSLKKRKALLREQAAAAAASKAEKKEEGQADANAAGGDQNKKGPASSSAAKKK